MKVIFEKPFFLQKTFGKQTIKYDSFYRTMQFVELCDKNGIYLAYNMLTKELAELSKDEYMLLSDSEFSPAVPAALPLIETWFAVPTTHDDINLYNELSYLYNSFDYKNFIDKYTILTTTDCNARCFYCYEKNIPRISMTEETAHKTAEFIASNSNNKKVHISWFGGEPLCNKKVIDIITTDLKSRQISFYSSMITNGYLFDDYTVCHAKEKWNLKSVQITLDGTDEVYNRCKNYIYNDSNPFERVCNNIDALLSNGITVKIRLNIDLHNYNNLEELADFIAVRYKGKKKIHVYVALLFDFSGIRTVDIKELLINSVLRIEQKLFESGILVYGIGKNDFVTNYCMADNKHAALINPNGELGRCEHYPNDFLWGTVDNPDFSNSALKKWQIKQNISDNCKKCKYYIECLAPKNCPSFGKMCDMFDIKLRTERKKRSMYAAYLNKIKR